MDRLSRSLAFYGFGLVLTASGCKMTRPEVPPGRPYANDGRQRPAIDFSSGGHPVDGSAVTNIIPDSPGASRLGQGIGSGASRPNVAPILGGAGGAFGPPGTSGRSDPSPADNMVLPTDTSPTPRPSIEPSPATAAPEPTTLPPDAEPRPEVQPPPSQSVAPAMDTPGRMGRANDFPSPN